MSSPTFVIERETKEGVKSVDIKPAVFDLRIETDTLQLTLGVGEVGYARPNEVAQMLKNSMTCEIVALPFHRKSAYRLNETGQIVSPMDL